MITPFSVSQFINQVNDLIVGEYSIEGEVSQYKISQNKWIFFDLKDEAAVLNCFSTVYTMHTPLEDGMRVRVTGYPKIYEKSGRFSFTVQKVELLGEGSLQRAYQLLKNKLTLEGIFDIERKRPVLEIPEHLGVIASRDSAAWGDFKRIISNRWGGVEIFLQNVSVQGEKAVEEIVEAIKSFNHSSIRYDALVLIRGGGSLEDLAAFNSEQVVRAIYESRIPVVCGVGHERDESLADLVADIRASTPSNAAELVVPDRKDFIKKLLAHQDYLAQTLEFQLHKKKQNVKQFFLVSAHQYGLRLEQAKSLLATWKRIPELLDGRRLEKQKFLSSAVILFKNVNPKTLLKRGFSITRKLNGQIVRAAGDVDKGEKIMIELGQGEVGAEII
jgi:exodeoxyribonuclease VII large subunit